MAHMNQVKKAVIQTALKPVLAKYNMKGSLAVRNHSTIVLTLSKGPIDFIAAYTGWGDGERLHEAYQAYWMGVNQYYLDRYVGTAREFLTECLAALKAANWYDKSDISIDYFNVAYHIDITVGRWNKPYILTR